MIIGVDFDNTIVSYDALFHKVATEQELVPASIPRNKTAVRDWLRQQDREDEWTRLQGEVYGARMAEAEIYTGVRDFFQQAQSSGSTLYIISHKTKYPFLGDKHDLHAAARQWLEAQGFFSDTGWGLPRECVFFELTKEEKIARISACGCHVFIDDLPEILSAPDMPTDLARILFDPADLLADWGLSPRALTWAKITQLLFPRIDASF